MILIYPPLAETYKMPCFQRGIAPYVYVAVKARSRESVLSKGPKQQQSSKGKVPFVVTFHPSFPHIRKITGSNHDILHLSDRLYYFINNLEVQVRGI